MDATVVGFAGMTHLGIVSAIAAAARGFSVIGYDSDENLVSRLGGQDLPILEPVSTSCWPRTKIAFASAQH